MSIVEERKFVQTPEERAAGITERWERFVDGQDDTFLAYFMVEYPDQETVRSLFLESIEANTTLPLNGREPVLKSVRFILDAVSNRYDDMTPYDVIYTGKRTEPIQ